MHQREVRPRGHQLEVRPAGHSHIDLIIDPKQFLLKLKAARCRIFFSALQCRSRLFALYIMVQNGCGMKTPVAMQILSHGIGRRFGKLQGSVLHTVKEAEKTSARCCEPLDRRVRWTSLLKWQRLRLHSIFNRDVRREVRPLEQREVRPRRQHRVRPLEQREVRPRRQHR